MTRIVITGWPRAGKTTLAKQLAERHGYPLRHTDDLIGTCSWSEASDVASRWLDEPGPWIIEGVAMSRALRKWRERNPDQRPPVDRVIMLRHPYEQLERGQVSMGKGVDTVHEDVGAWLEEEHGIVTEAP